MLEILLATFDAKRTAVVTLTLVLTAARKKGAGPGADLTPINCHARPGGKGDLREGSGEVASPNIGSLAPGRPDLSQFLLLHFRPFFSRQVSTPDKSPTLDLRKTTRKPVDGHSVS
jgi:hypothetical protein